MNNYNYQGYKQNEPNFIQSQSSPPNFNDIYQVNDGLSYSEYILLKNIGKKIKVYMTFTGSIEWRDRVFEGTFLAVGRDFILIKENQNKTYMLWNVYINYIEFNEQVIID